MRHFGIYANSGDVQAAISAETLVNPYVALVSGALDYNSLTPEEPCYLGEWSDDGQGHYTFRMFDGGDVAWLDEINIGQLKGVYFNGNQGWQADMDMDVTLRLDGPWIVTFVDPEEVDPEESASPFHDFEDGISGTWDCEDVMTDGDSSTASVHVDYDGIDTFEFYQMAQDAPALSMDTINPECPPSE